MDNASPPTAAGERGWWWVLTTAVLLMMVPVLPPLRVLLPVEQTVVLLAPALAVCAVVGWGLGGRGWVAGLSVAFASAVVWQAAHDGAFASLVCGWALLLAVGFGALVVWQSAAGPTPFFSRAFGATALALLLAGSVAVAVPDGFATAEQAVLTETGRRAAESLAEWRQVTAGPQWRQQAAASPALTTLSSQMETQLQGSPEVAAQLFPALLVLESLAALVVAWTLYHRVGGTRLGLPLAALKEFRFNDQLVWGLIAGLAMVVVPGFAPVRGLGMNLLALFGVLYILRGYGVMLWFLRPGRLAMAMLVGFSLMFWYVIGILALSIGLGDTWRDWRSRVRTKT